MNPSDESKTNKQQEMSLAENNQVKDTPTEELSEVNSDADHAFGEDILTEASLANCFTFTRLDTQTKLMILNVYKYMKEYRLVQAMITGNDMNVNTEVTKATGISQCTIRALKQKYHKEGIERAIGPHIKTKLRRRKTDVFIEVDQSTPAKTSK